MMTSLSSFTFDRDGDDACSGPTSRSPHLLVQAFFRGGGDGPGPIHLLKSSQSRARPTRLFSVTFGGFRRFLAACFRSPPPIPIIPRDLFKGTVRIQDLNLYTRYDKKGYIGDKGRGESVAMIWKRN